MYRTSLPVNPLKLIALNRDVFFGVRLRNLAKELGYDLTLAPTAAAVEAALAESANQVALVIIDMNVLKTGVDWDAVRDIIVRYPDVPTLGFGSHTDVETRRTAKQVGVTRIVANSEFQRDAAALIQRYARVLDGTET
jgi:hypothetical protein